VICSRETAFKVRNLQRDPRAWHDGVHGRLLRRWVQLEDTAEVVALPAAIEGLVDYYRSVREHPDWDEYRAVMVSDRRCLVRITSPRRARTGMG
jgi:hypothetical protein